MLEHGGTELARIHGEANRKKHFCYLTGYLEGIAASGHLESGEVQPLITVCGEFFENLDDPDAGDLFQDFEADILEAETISLIISERTGEIDETCAKSVVNRFLGFCAGIACDGSLLETEVRAILRLAERLGESASRPGIREVINTAKDALRDDIITADEERSLARAISNLVGDSYADTGMSEISSPVSIDEDRIENFPGELVGLTIVLTGEFQEKPRRRFERRMSAIGVRIEKNITSRTDMVVVGGRPSRDWLETNRGHKIIRALQLRSAGGVPRMVSEQQLLTLFDRI